MPIPKFKNPEDITVNDVVAKKLITVIKPYKDAMPDILDRASELAAEAAKKEGKK